MFRSIGFTICSALVFSSVVLAFCCQEAYDQCDYRFANQPAGVVPTFTVDNNVVDTPFTPKIVSKIPFEFPGVLNTNNITPEFIVPGGDPPITQFGTPPFTPTHFKPFSIPNAHMHSGIGHQTFQGNQLMVAKGKCVRIYFTHIQLLSSPNGNVAGNLNDVPRSENKCVVFWTQ